MKCFLLRVYCISDFYAPFVCMYNVHMYVCSRINYRYVFCNFDASIADTSSAIAEFCYLLSFGFFTSSVLAPIVKLSIRLVF